MIKQSKTLVKNRKVETWTRVLIGTDNFPEEIKKVTLEYRIGDILGEREE